MNKLQQAVNASQAEEVSRFGSIYVGIIDPPGKHPSYLPQAIQFINCRKYIFGLPNRLNGGQDLGVLGVINDARKKTDVVKSMRRSCAKVTIRLE
jgi:hypothetical protein